MLWTTTGERERREKWGELVDSVDQHCGSLHPTRRSALHCAAYTGSLECLRLLLEAGANVNTQDSEGVTALHWACAGGHTDCVQLLLASGAYPNSMEQSQQQLTPLDYAILEGHQDLAQLLIEQGALTMASIQELAAIMIQKVVRGFLARKRVSNIRSTLVRTEEHHKVVMEGKEPVSTKPGSAAAAPADSEKESSARERKLAAERRRALQARLAEADKKAQAWTFKGASSVGKHASGWEKAILSLNLLSQGAVRSDLAKKDRHRVFLYREKTKAALIIQLAWRRSVH